MSDVREAEGYLRITGRLEIRDVAKDQTFKQKAWAVERYGFSGPA